MSNAELDALLQAQPVLAENTAMAQIAGRQGVIENFSQEQVEPSDAFNTHNTANSAAATLTMQSQHLNLVATAPGVTLDTVMAYKQEIKPLADQLAQLKLPDTKVNLHNELGGRPLKIEIPYEIKQYANDLNQAQYNKFLRVLLGPDRMITVRAASTKANQGTTPALWMNQQICVETKKPSVFTLAQDRAEELVRSEERLDLTPSQKAEIPPIIQACLGPTLFEDVVHIARANQIPLYVLFILLVDLVLANYKTAAKVTTPSSIWEDVTPPDEQRDHDMTAAEAVKVS